MKPISLLRQSYVWVRGTERDNDDMQAAPEDNVQDSDGGENFSTSNQPHLQYRKANCKFLVTSGLKAVTCLLSLISV